MTSSDVVLVCAAGIIAAAVFAVARRADVRLALPLAGLALGLLGGDAAGVVRKFLVTLSNEQFIVPLCTAMGFARVLRQTGCDRHLVLILAAPLRRVRLILVPGTVLLGFCVNVPVISQTGTVVTIGPVLLPLLRTAGIPPVTAGAALLLGTSIGGELLNPGAPELRTISNDVSQGQPAPTPAKAVVAHSVRLLPLHLATATLVFWAISLRADRRTPATDWPPDVGPESKDPFRVNPFKAMIPLLPVAILFVAGPPWELWPVPRGLLVGPDEPGSHAESRLIGLAMLIGSAAAALSAGRSGAGSARAFFEGAGYSYTHVIAVIVAAATFGSGVEAVGLPDRLGKLTAEYPGLLVPLAAAIPYLFALVCGSGMASTQSLYHFFVDPARAQGLDPVALGALVAAAAAGGRTSSPVAAVTLLCAGMVGAAPLALARRVAVPILCGLAVTLLARAWWL
jgi:DcuC family C4-dicarboxylate transporter